MEINPVSKIYSLIRNLGVVKHKKRQEFLCSMVEGVIKSRSVVFSQISDKMDLPIQVESTERMIQDFFQKVNFDYLQLGIFLLGFIHHKKVLLSIDRTEWDFGKTQVNILCVVASVGRMAVPLYFEMLNNNSGNSNSDDRISLFKSLIGIVGRERIELLVMDREFIGNKWLSWLKNLEIDFCVRVPKHHKIMFPNLEQAFAQELLADLGVFRMRKVIVDGVEVNLSVSYGSDGELLYLIGTPRCKDLEKIYKRRWSIEVFFQALKKRGFNLEESCLRCLEKYRKLFALVSIAYTICWATGIQDGKKNPVHAKKHGYPQYSVFRRGLNLMRKFYRNQIREPILMAVLMAEERILEIIKRVG